MDVTGMIMGFGLGAVAASIFCDFLHLQMFTTVFFFLGGLLGAVLASGEFGDLGFNFGDIFGS